MQRIIGLFGIVFFILFIALPVSPPQEIQEDKYEPVARIIINGPVILLEVEFGNIYNGYQVKFTEHFEIAYFIFNNGNVIRFTNKLADRVILPDLTNLFNRLNIKFEDLMVVIHNHLYLSGFSRADIRLYYKLKRLGFSGEYQIYFPFAKKVITYVEK